MFGYHPDIGYFTNEYEDDDEDDGNDDDENPLDFSKYE